MSNTHQQLTRNQLAEFLPNLRAVRAFEQILKQTGDTIPTDITTIQVLVEEVFVNAQSGVATAQEALDTLHSIERSLSILASYPIQQQNNSVKTDYLDLSVGAPTAAESIGRLKWGPTGTLEVSMGSGNIIQQVGEELFVYGKASATITEGQLIMVGASGVLTFAPTTTGLTDPNTILGVATENLATNAFGRVTIIGIVHGINTTGSSVGEVWANGDVLWYNPNFVGGMTKVKPSAPNMKTQVAIVINASSGGSGSLQVEVLHGSTLGGTDSNVQFGELSNGQLVQYDAVAGYWKNVVTSTITEPPITAGTAAQYWRGDKTWQDLFTQVRSTTLTGLSTATNTVITAADTVLSAAGKLQAQISVILAGKLSQFASTTSAELAGVISDETGSGKLVFGTNPTLTTPIVAATIGVGGVTPSASGSGVSFPATQSASTDPNTLDDYEEGSYAPTVTAVSGAITSYTATAIYTKVGRQVTVAAKIVITNNGTGASAVYVTMPFASGSVNCAGCGRENGLTGSALQVFLGATGSAATVFTYNNGYPGGTNAELDITITYMV